MASVGDHVLKVRSKNAGPFWLTIDIFCGDRQVFDHVRSRLNTDRVAALFRQSADNLKRFDIDDLNVIKFSDLAGLSQDRRRKTRR